jgi:hypothetical protein
MQAHCSYSFLSKCALILAAAGLGLLPLAAPGATAAGQTFATPEQAVVALTEAVRTTNAAALRALFGPEADDLVNPDPIQAANEFAAFAAALAQTNRLVPTAERRQVLEVGTQAHPFAVPLVRVEAGWVFDTASGIQEVCNRRVGRNELGTLKTMRAFVAAQREYASQDRDGSQVLQYAQRIFSSPGKKDGLYWPPELDGETSPLGPLVARAQDEGYHHASSPPDAAPEPYHGYYFRILTRQGAHAPGGKHDYILNSCMIAGFAVIAWPASYGETGIMTFLVNQQGRVFQKDLGSKTASRARKITAYDPDPSWQPSRD